MRLIDRYICKEIFSHTLLGLVIFTFVLLVPKLVEIMELVVRNSGAPSRLGLLLLCMFPALFSFTFPMAVLVGVLIGLGRLSADSELIALSALGIGIRRVLVPVGILATGMGALTLMITLWIGPAAQRTFNQIRNELAASTASYEIKPRVFDERFPGMTFYIQDVTAAATHWRGVFVSQSGSDESSKLTLAEDAIVIADRSQGKLELHLRNGSEHEVLLSDPDHYNVTTFAASDWPIQVNGADQQKQATLTTSERPLSDLMTASGPTAREARVEIQRRFAFPVACFVFALVAVPLAARPRRGGRAMGFLVSLLIVCGYYLLFIIGVGMARRGIVHPFVGVWAANILTAIAGLALLPGMEQIRGATWFSRLMENLSTRVANLYERIRGGHRHDELPGRPEAVPSTSTEENPPRKRRSPETAAEAKARVVQLRPVRPAMRVRHNSSFPQRLDLYLLGNFCSYLLLVMAGFIFLFEIFTFFELLDDIAKNHTPFLVVLNYFRFLVPFLVYKLAPFAVLVAAMVTLGVMSKNNEVVAFKASGVSLYRLAWPIIGASAVLALGMLALDNSYLPYFNQRQDALRAEIKGRPPQAHMQSRNWIFGLDNKIYNYQIFDPVNDFFGGLNVFELDPQTFQLRRRIYAREAQWQPEQNAWLLKDGWIRDFEGDKIARYAPFKDDTVAELSEKPAYFSSEVQTSDQMSWASLETYIAEMRRDGFDVERLTVQWHEKLAFPMIAPIIAFLSIPFAFYVGTRGAVGGLAVGVGIGITYWASHALFEALGGIGQLPPLLAGWAPDAIFIFFGAYFFLKMPT